MSQPLPNLPSSPGVPLEAAAPPPSELAVIATPSRWWFVAGLVCVLVATIVVFLLPAKHAAPNGTDVFQAADGFASLAGFTFLAAALERIAEFTLAPWWGKVRVVSKPEATLATHPAAPPLSRVGVAGAAVLQAKSTSSTATMSTTDADSVYVDATKQRPTIMLPMAAIAAVACSCMHLFLLHSLARSGVSTSRGAFTVDGLLTGFAIAGGAQPFHDLVTSLTATSAAKQAAAATTPDKTG